MPIISRQCQCNGIHVIQSEGHSFPIDIVGGKNVITWCTVDLISVVQLKFEKCGTNTDFLIFRHRICWCNLAWSKQCQPTIMVSQTWSKISTTANRHYHFNCKYFSVLCVPRTTHTHIGTSSITFIYYYFFLSIKKNCTLSNITEWVGRPKKIINLVYGRKKKFKLYRIIRYNFSSRYIHIVLHFDFFSLFFFCCCMVYWIEN